MPSSTTSTLAPLLVSAPRPLGEELGVHAFEFMDLPALPASLRAAMRDALEASNSWPFRRYYDAVTRVTLEVAKEHHAEAIVELGAGTAPITSRLLATAGERRLICCDSNPDALRFAALARRDPRVEAIGERVELEDLGARWPGAVIVVSAVLHHVPPADRKAVLRALRRHAAAVIVAEPLRCNVWSLLLNVLILIPALLTPLLLLHRPGHRRRMLWCWLLPLVPLLLLWDGTISCLRQWSSARWLRSRPRRQHLTLLSRIAEYDGRAAPALPRDDIRRLAKRSSAPA